MAIAYTITNPEREVRLVYTNVRVIGSGAFGMVRYARLHPSGEEVAVKRVFDDPRYRNRELQITRILDHPNIVRLKYYYYLENAGGRFLYLILEYMPDTLLNVIKRWDAGNAHPSARMIQTFMYQLMRALDYLHNSVNVCHRDIKPENILVDTKGDVVKLCDFGSAKQLEPDEPNVAYICSRYYRAPELILGVTNYTVAIDVWSLGCCFGEMILRKEPLFPGQDKYDQLVCIAKVLGTDELFKYINKCRMKVDPHFNAILGRHPRKRWERFINTENQHLMTPEAIDLLDKVLRYDHVDRLTARKALDHPYFTLVVNPPSARSERSAGSSRGGRK